MPDLSNAEISVEGEYGECLVCGESFHWEQLTNTEEGPYCDDHVNGDDKADPSAVMSRALSTLTTELEQLVAVFADLTVAMDEAADVLNEDASDDEADMGHDTNLERDTFGDAL